MTVRRLGRSDADSGRAALKAVFGPENGEPGLETFLDDPRAYLLVAYEGEAPVGIAYGYALPRPKRRPSAMLMSEIEVAPAVRRANAIRWTRSCSGSARRGVDPPTP